MSRIACGLLLLSLLAGAGCNAPSAAPPLPIVDRQQANVEVSAFVKLAREYLARKDFDKAIETLEKAMLVEGATERREATELLASIMPLKNGAIPTSNKTSRTDRYSAALGPAEVVKGYLTSSSWQERLAFVLTPVETGPMMSKTYGSHVFDPNAFQPGTILPLKKETIGVGERMLVTVDVTESSPESPFWKYVVERTAEGYKIDWQASQEIKWAEDDATAKRALQLENPVLEVQLLKVEPTAGFANVHFKISNRSNKRVSNCQLHMELNDRAGAYVSQETISAANLEPGSYRIEQRLVESKTWAQSAKRKFSPHFVTIELGGEQSRNATKYFSVVEKK